MKESTLSKTASVAVAKVAFGPTEGKYYHESTQ